MSFDRRRPAQAEDVRELRLLAEDLFDLRLGLVAAEREVEVFAAIEADDVGEEADLRGRPVAVGAVDLPVDVPGVDEQHLVGARRLLLAPVEKPQRHRQGDRVEHVRADGDHHIHGAGPRSAGGESPARMTRASEAEFAITNPARPFSLSAE